MSWGVRHRAWGEDATTADEYYHYSCSGFLELSSCRTLPGWAGVTS